MKKTLFVSCVYLFVLSGCGESSSDESAMSKADSGAIDSESESSSDGLSNDSTVEKTAAKDVLLSEIVESGGFEEYAADEEDLSCLVEAVKQEVGFDQLPKTEKDSRSYESSSSIVTETNLYLKAVREAPFECFEVSTVLNKGYGLSLEDAECVYDKVGEDKILSALAPEVLSPVTVKAFEEFQDTYKSCSGTFLENDQFRTYSRIREK